MAKPIGPVPHRPSLLNGWKEIAAYLDGQLTSKFKTSKAQATQAGHDFLWLELATGRSFVKLALTAVNDGAAARRRKVARMAYDSIERHLPFTNGLPPPELDEFNAELREFKFQLQELDQMFSDLPLAV